MRDRDFFGEIVRGDFDDLDELTRPYENEHAARLRQPGLFVRIRQLWAREGIRGLGGPLKSKPSGSGVIQALRFNRHKWTVAKARKWLKDHGHKPILFEPATGKGPKRSADELALPVVVRRETAKDEDRSIEVVVASERAIAGVNRDFRLVDQVLIINQRNLPNGPVTLIDSHDRSSVLNALGSVRDWQIEQDGGDRLLVGRAYFADNEKGRQTYPLYRDAHLNDVSIRAAATEAIVAVEPGRTFKMQGRSFQAGVRTLEVFRRWEAREISAVVRGGDDAAKVRRTLQEEIDMKHFERWLLERGENPGELTEARRAEFHKEYLQEVAEAQRAEIEKQVRSDLAAEAAAGTADPAAATTQRAAQDPADIAKLVGDEVERRLKAREDQAKTDEVTRRAEIHDICGDEHAEIERQAVAEGWGQGQTHKAILEAVRKQLESGISAPAVHSGGGMVTREVIEDAMVLRAGNEDIILADKENGTKRAEQAQDLREMALVELCRMALVLEGEPVPRSRDDMMRAAFSTHTLPQLLGNVANKSLMKGYGDQAATWREWCSTGSVSDFKTQTKARLTDTGELVEVGPSGEIPHGGATEEYEQYSIATYAKQFVITRQSIINDDLGVFTRTPQRMGVAAARLISKLVYTHLLLNGDMQDSIALFHATHGNLQTGAGYKLSAGNAALQIAQQLMRKQTNAEGDSIDIMAKVVLCNPEDEVSAEIILSSLALAEGTTWGVGTKNIWANKGIKPVTESRLSNTNYSGNSTTAWYLMGDPAQVDTVEVGFLNGNQNPTIERFNQKEIGINTLGIGFRVYQDVGVKALDWRGMVRMDGA